MRTTTLYNSLVGMAIVAVLSGCESTGSAKRSIEPPFEWDITGEFATPGTSLTLTELARAGEGHIVFGSNGPKVFIYYEIKATGFTPGEPLQRWTKIGEKYNEHNGTVDADGVFRMTGHYEAFGIFDYVPGQPLNVALTTETYDKRAHAKVFPYPIEAHGTSGCSILMSLELPTGRHWFARLEGFEPGQPVHVVRQFKGKIIEKTETASDQGEVRFPITFKRGANGVASLTATSDNCTVAVQYNVGYDAINPTNEHIYYAGDSPPEILSMEEALELLDSLGYGSGNNNGEK